MKKAFWTITVVLVATVSLFPVPKMKPGNCPFESTMEQSLYEELHAAETDLKHADDAEQESQAWARYHVAVKNLLEWSRERLRRNRDVDGPSITSTHVNPVGPECRTDQPPRLKRQSNPLSHRCKQRRAQT